MKKQIKSFVILGVVLMYACTPAKKEEAASTEPEVAEVEMSNTVVMATHTVADFDAWYQVYNDADSMRGTSGFTYESVYRGVDDSLMVTVTAYTQGHASAKEFFSREELRQKMGESGVVGKPDFSYWDVIWRRDGEGDQEYQAFMAVRHDVENIDAWLEKFHAHDSTRLAFGIKALVVGSNADSTNHVGAWMGITDLELAGRFESESDLKQVMEDAGVVGPPMIINVYPVK